jgi:hypothetical protein
MQRPDEPKVNEEDAELLQQVKNLSLPPEQCEVVDGLEAHLERYGRLTNSDRKIARRLLK